MTGHAAKAATPRQPQRGRRLCTRVDAIDNAELAVWHLQRALAGLSSAGSSLEACGYRGARVGVRQVAARVRAWIGNLEAGIAAARAR